MRKLALLLAAAAVLLLILVVTQNSSPALASNDTADHIVVRKSAHTMTLYSGARELKTYRVALGRGPGHAKQQQGDHETPEGQYTIDTRRERSRFHLALHVSYPNATDRALARNLGKDPRRRHHDPRPPSRLRMGRPPAPEPGLDRRLHRRFQR